MNVPAAKAYFPMKNNNAKQLFPNQGDPFLPRFPCVCIITFTWCVCVPTFSFIPCWYDWGGIYLWTCHFFLATPHCPVFIFRGFIYHQPAVALELDWFWCLKGSLKSLRTKHECRTATHVHCSWRVPFLPPTKPHQTCPALRSSYTARVR